MKNSSKQMVMFLVAFMLILSFSQIVMAQNGTIANRETADPQQTGYAKWIKITVKGGPGGNDNLDDNFLGMKFLVDLNVDLDNNENTHTGDVYELRGNIAGEIVSTPTGTNDYDSYFYLPVKQGTDTPYPVGETGYPTSLQPRVWLQTSGQLRVGTAPFSFPIGIDAQFEICDDGIKPVIRKAYYYDDGTGNTIAVANVHSGNITPFDGRIDRVDLIWSEPMQTPVTPAVVNGMFTNLGSTIYGIEPVGEWNVTPAVIANPETYLDPAAVQQELGQFRFTFYPFSSQPNSGIQPILNYNPPASPDDRFRELRDSANPYAYAQTRALTDKAGPAIVSAKTKRANRRQPLANALTSRRVEVTFSEPVLLSTVTGSDFEVFTNGTLNPITGIISPVAPTTSSSVYEFQLTNNFATENETGTIQYTDVETNEVRDILGNVNGHSTAQEPPVRPANSRGLVIPITDGIFPNIIQVTTVDADPATQMATGGTWGWGYLDYVDVLFDHAMNITRTSVSGFSVSGMGIQTVGGTGVWLEDGRTFRVPLVATDPKLPNTGIIPTVTYTNPADPYGCEATNGGNAENLLSTDTYVSSNNYLAVQILDGAGPAIIKAYTAGRKRIRVSFSEKVNTNGWPTSLATSQAPTRFKWYVGATLSDPITTTIFFTGLSGGRQDSVVYLNHNSSEWAKTDSGGINFFAQGAVFDLNGIQNMQWDNDNSLLIRNLTNPDVKVRRDNIAPILLVLETVDIDLDGKLDHYRFSFDDLSPIFPRSSFNVANWSITGYDGVKNNLQVDLNVYNPFHSFFQPTAINTFGDTVEVFVKFDETTGAGPEVTPYGGDTGDVPDVVVDANNGFADWADNVMAALPVGLTVEADKAGPAIMSARTVNTYQVETFISENLKSSTINKEDFVLDMGLNVGIGWSFDNVTQVSPGKVVITVYQNPTLFWSPTQNGTVQFSEVGVVTDNISGTDNGNMQVAEINVNDHAASKFLIAPALDDPEIPMDDAQIVGVQFFVEIIALDSHDSLDTNFPYLIELSSNLTQDEIDLPDGPSRLTNGVGYFPVTCWKETENLLITVSVPNVDQYTLVYNTSDPITVVPPVIDTPDTLIVRDYRGADGLGDQGGYVQFVFDYSANHPGIGIDNIISYYQIYRKTFNEGIPEISHWCTIPATDPGDTGADSLITGPVYTGDNVLSQWMVRAVYTKALNSKNATITTDQAGTEPRLIRRAGRVVLRTEDNGVSTTYADQIQYVSGYAMANGRAIDNIAPKSPEYLLADKEGVTVNLHWQKVTVGINGMPEITPVKYELFSNNSKAYFNPATEGTLIATLSDTTYMVNSEDLRAFFCVRAIDSDNQSELSDRVGKYGFHLDRGENSVYNYISFPLHNSFENAKGLANKFKGIEVALQLEERTNGFSKYYLPDLNFGQNFELHVGMPLLLSLKKSAEASWFYSGRVPAAESVQFALNRSAAGSYNEITVPLDKTNIKTADDLAKDIGGVEVVLKLNPETNGFSQFWIPSIKYGTNFEIAPGEAVLINVNNSAPAVWPTYSTSVVQVTNVAEE